MKRYIFLFAAFLVTVVSCEEFGPVVTDQYDDPVPSKIYTDADFEGSTFITIEDLKAMYTPGNPFVIEEDLVIKGQVTTSDEEGNFYRSMYIQDSTSGIELKIGKTGLYNVYKPGQWIYVKCKGLSLGAYGRMVQLGYEDLTGKYETSYIDVQLLVDLHIFKGKQDTLKDPIVITSGDDILSEEYVGRYVTVKGLSYGNRVFVILYDKNDNSLYLSNETHGVDTWAFSEEGFAKYLANQAAMDKGDRDVPNPEDYEPAFYSVSQYFTLGNADLQVRTSGYAKFADYRLVSSGITAENAGKISLTGIMTVYNENYQFVLVDLDGVKIEE